MYQTPLPFLFFRGGTSRGPFFRLSDLPTERDALSKALCAIIGSGHPLNIDGIGGGAAVTTKVAILSPSGQPNVDIDYLFAQVPVTEGLVDYRPTCGNMLAAVGPAALEMGLIEANGASTQIVIRSVNTGAIVNALIQTPGGRVTYNGNTRIDGVPGSAAPVLLDFTGVVGSVSGKLLPTGNLRDRFGGIEVTCMDVAIPVVIARAADFGLTGRETASELDANSNFLARMERIRCEAARQMGLGDVSQSVTPKFALISPPAKGGAISARYFMPWKCHPTMAVTGAQCIASCALAKGSIADGIDLDKATSPVLIEIEHPGGTIGVTVVHEGAGRNLSIKSVGLTRTARLLARGEVFLAG